MSDSNKVVYAGDTPLLMKFAHGNIITLKSKATGKNLRVDPHGVVDGNGGKGKQAQFSVHVCGENKVAFQNVNDPDHWLAIYHDTLTGNCKGGKFTEFKIEEQGGFAVFESVEYPGLRVGIKSNGGAKPPSNTHQGQHAQFTPEVNDHSPPLRSLDSKAKPEPKSKAKPEPIPKAKPESEPEPPKPTTESEPEPGWSIGSLLLFPITSLLKNIPLGRGRLNNYRNRVVAYLKTHPLWSIAIMLLIFTPVLYIVPDTFIPPVDTMKSAKTMKSLYCNQSTMSELLFQHFKSWYPRNGQTCNGPLCGFKEAESIGMDLPVINIGYLKGLANYVCNVPKEQVLVVYGPSGSGIKKGLEQMEQVWREQGRAVVRVDLSYFEGGNSTDELFGLIQKAILDGFKGRALTVTTIQALHELLKGDAKQSENDDDFITLLSKLVMQLPLTPILRRTLSGFYDSKISSLDSFLGSFMTGDTAAVSQIDFHNFLRAMDIISLYQPDLAPIIVFQRFEALRGTVLIDSIFELLKEHEQVGNCLPIIISTQWFHKMHFLQLTHTFNTFEVWELDKGTTKEILVETLQIWTEEDFDIIWKALGGYEESIIEVYEYNQNFALNIDKALEKIHHKALERVHEFAYRTSIPLSRSDSSAQEADISTSPLNVLSKLVAHDYHLVLDTIEQVTAAMESLIEANLLYVDSGLGLRPVSRSIQVAIKKCLEVLTKQKADQTTKEKPQEATREKPQEATQAKEPQEIPDALNPQSDSTNEEQNPMKTQTQPQQSEESQTQMEQPKDTDHP